MKLSKRTLLKLKNKNKKLKPEKYKKLKREALRGRIKGTLDRPRLSVYRSNENIYAQIIDDTSSKTLLACSTLDRSIKLGLANGRTCDASRLEVVVGIEIEILVSHVPAAGDSRDPVKNRRFVVHTLIDAAELGGDIDELADKGRADRQVRVVDADLHVGVSSQQRQRFVSRVDQYVVDEYPDLDASFGGAQQTFGRQDTDIVRTPDEVLDVDALLGVL